MKRINIRLIISSILFYGMNQCLKPIYTECVFMNGYFNDVLAGLLLISFTNLMFDKINKSFYSLLKIEGYLCLVGLFWEYITPLYNQNSTSDPFDILAYMIGGLVYFVIIKKVKKIKDVK